MNEDIQYPIGKYQKPQIVSDQDREIYIQQIASLPNELRVAVQGLNDAQLDTPYRDGGWTVRQVVHHLPDSQVNGYIRFKLGLTENEPTIKPYEETLWAEIEEAKRGPIEVSLNFLDAVHTRWAASTKGLSSSMFERKIKHPQSGVMTLNQLLALYAWHGRHHVAHIKNFRKRRGW